ncbi:MAG: VWA domain-containing protein [Planctomycetaceae bacterium]
MTFLNQILVFGAAAFLIPLIIHILNRSRFKTVEWGAMHLLESVIKVNHRRFQIEQLILLLIRCAIPILIALCLARPVLTGAQALEGDAPVSLVVILDTSYSMDTVDTNGTRFEHAVTAATEIIESTGRGSEISVILTGGKPTPLFDQPMFDSGAVVRRLKQQQAGFGASDMQGALDEAMATIAGMTQVRRELVIISDFQPADWSPIGGESSIRKQMETMNIAPFVTLIPVGIPASGNVTVDAIEFPQRAFGVGQRVDVRATVRNHGKSPVEKVRVVMRIDGEEADISQVTLAANSSTQLLFPYSFDNAGSHTVEIVAAANDALTTDNRMAAAINIWDKIKVLLVDGDQRAAALESETDFLAIALTPFTFGRVRLADLVETQTVTPNLINEELLQTCQVVVLANVAKLDDAQLDDLVAYVEEGGALLVTAGDRIDRNWYHERLFADGAGLLPAPFGEVQGQVDNQGPTARIVAGHFDHPAMEFFNVPANGDLSKGEFRRWMKLEPITAESPESSAETSVLARLDTGDPLLLEQRFGEGNVLQFASTCDTDWTDLPLRPFYVPLMQQLITTMASGLVPPRNIATGDPAVAILNATDPGATLSMVTPDGSRRTLQTVAEGRTILARFDQTQRPGIYSMSLPSTETIHFVAETSRNESDLETLNEESLVALSETLGSSLVKSSEEYLQQDQLRRHGREIWRYFLMGFLCLMVLELILQQRFARVHV